MYVVVHVQDCECVDVHLSDYGYNNGWLVTEGDNYNVDDGNDECFTVMVMIITIVVLVLLPSVTDKTPSGTHGSCTLHTTAQALHQLQASA